MRVEGHERKREEHLRRYITRQALSAARVQISAAGQGELKTPWRDGTTHLVLSTLEFKQRLAALVPRPSMHQPMIAIRRRTLAIGRPGTGA
jgi:hypothetical protein